MLNLSTRPAMLGNSINTLLGDPHGWDAMFDSGKNPVDPVFQQFKPLQFKDAFKDCAAEIAFGLQRDVVKVANARLKRVKLEPQVGGAVHLSCLVHGHLAATKATAMLDAFLNHDVEVTLSIGEAVADDQRELPLNQHGEGEQPEAGDGKRRRRTRNGDQPAAH